MFALCGGIATSVAIVMLWGISGYWTLVVYNHRYFYLEAGGGTLELEINLIGHEQNLDSELEFMALPDRNGHYDLVWWFWWLEVYSTDITVLCPFWFLLLLVSVPTCVLYWGTRRGRALAGHCSKCGYDLRGNVSDRCPECGAAVDDTKHRQSISSCT